MKPIHASLIRGLNIGITVLAALSLITCVVGMTFLGVNKDYLYAALEEEYGASVYDPDYLDDFYDDYLDDFYFDHDLWDDDYGTSHPHHASLSTESLVPVSDGYFGYSTSSEDVEAIMDIALAVVNALLIWEIIVSAVTLVFGILGIVGAGKQEKLKALTVCGIVGAVIAFLGGHIVLVVLFIISAVMANKDKTTALNQAILS